MPSKNYLICHFWFNVLDYWVLSSIVRVKKLPGNPPHITIIFFPIKSLVLLKADILVMKSPLTSFLKTNPFK